jgi:hypothetical protein
MSEDLDTKTENTNTTDTNDRDSGASVDRHDHGDNARHESVRETLKMRFANTVPIFLMTRTRSALTKNENANAEANALEEPLAKPSALLRPMPNVRPTPANQPPTLQHQQKRSISPKRRRVGGRTRKLYGQVCPLL